MICCENVVDLAPLKKKSTKILTFIDFSKVKDKFEFRMKTYFNMPSLD